MIENETTNSTIDIDTNGGWKVEHVTRQYDVRTRLDAIPGELKAAQDALIAAQAKVDELIAHQVEAAPFLDALAKAQPAASIEATSTPTTL